MKKVEVDIDAFVSEYRNTYTGLEAICLKYHIGKVRGRNILLENGVALRDSHSERKEHKYVVDDWRIEKYPPADGYHYIAVDKQTGYETSDYENRAGVLTTYIKNTYGVEIPTLHYRREYYKETGNYWWEQWFNIKQIKDAEVKKCPYCDWETVDLSNKSGAFEVHLKTAHNKTIDEYLDEFPEDSCYFAKHSRKIERDTKLENPDNYVVCPLCSKKFWRITESHLLVHHNMTMCEFRNKYPDVPVMSNNNLEQTRTAQTLGNLVVSKDRFVSKYEDELQNHLDEMGVKYEANRQLLIGREIDILIPSKNIGIEFDGLKWHTEWFGRKKHNYHLDKTVKCNESGYGLIHIFEDEYVNKKELVYEKLDHILGLSNSDKPIPARKCLISEITKNEASSFLEKYHIQGYAKSSVYLGAFYEDELVAVMSFKNGNVKNEAWELTRFAGKSGFRLQGVGGKLFKFFVNSYEPETVVSFADRRWTVRYDDNLYTKLGFVLDKVCPPDYRYYNERVDRYKRIHKMSFSKKTLSKRYGFPMTMTEKEMAKELGYDRIWDCGLFRYVWTKKTQG